MATVKVFLSFEFGRDNELYGDFIAQAPLHSDYKIIDCSLNEPYHPDALWLEKARKQIQLADIVIVLVGQDTHNAPGVEKEVGEANQIKKPIFQVRPRARTSGSVRGAGEVIQWNWKKIDEKIAECLAN